MINKRDSIFENIKYGLLKLKDLQYCYDEMIKIEEYEKVYIINFLIKNKYYDNDSNFNFLDDNDCIFTYLDELKNISDNLTDEENKKLLNNLKSKINDILGKC